MGAPTNIIACRLHPRLRALAPAGLLFAGITAKGIAAITTAVTAATASIVAYRMHPGLRAFAPCDLLFTGVAADAAAPGTIIAIVVHPGVAAHKGSDDLQDTGRVSSL